MSKNLGETIVAEPASTRSQLIDRSLPDSVRAMIPVVDYSGSVEIGNTPALSVEEATANYAAHLGRSHDLPPGLGALVLNIDQLDSFRDVALLHPDPSYAGQRERWSIIRNAALVSRAGNPKAVKRDLARVAKFDEDCGRVGSRSAKVRIPAHLNNLTFSAETAEDADGIAEAIMESGIVHRFSQSQSTHVYFEPTDYSLLDGDTKISDWLPYFSRSVEIMPNFPYDDEFNFQDFSHMYFRGVRIELRGGRAPSPEQLAHIMLSTASAYKSIPLTVSSRCEGPFTHFNSDGQLEYGVVNLKLAGAVVSRYGSAEEDLVTDLLQEQNPDAARFYPGGVVWKQGHVISTESIADSQPRRILCASLDAPFEGWDKLEMSN